MKTNFLVTESINQLYPEKENNKLIFQNESVLDFDNSNHQNYESFEVIRSSWNNRHNILQNVEKINLFYEEIIELLYSNLNIIHKKNYSKKFWRILVGPWINNFIVICFEKWNDFEAVFKTSKIDKSFFLDLDQLITASEHAHAMNLFSNRFFKQKINQEILKFFLNSSQIINVGKVKETISPWISTKESYIDDFFSIIFNKRRKKYFIAYTGLKKIDNILLNFSLNQLPINYKFINYKSLKVKSESLRKKLLSNFYPKNNFEICIKNLILKEFPLCFLEDFDNFEKWSSKRLLPLNPKIIFSSFLLWKNSLSQYFIAKKTEEGSKLVYRQHGANFGAVKYASGEVHEKKVCDKFLTWGWTEDQYKSKIEKSGVRILKIKPSIKKVKKIIVTLRSRKKHVQTIALGAYGNIRYTDYIQFSQNFLLSLNENIKKKIILRFPPHINDPKSQDFYNLLSDKFYLENKKNFYDLILEDNFFLHTNHSTAFLETLAHNCPTIGVWDDKNFFLKKEYSKFYEQMKKVGIIYTDINSAKNFLNKLNFEEINNWWSQKELQKIKDEFVHNYANTENFNYKNLKKLFLSL